MAGHSAGGQVAEDYALKKTGGLILLVSCSSPASSALCMVCLLHSSPFSVALYVLGSWTTVPVHPSLATATEGAVTILLVAL